MSGEMIPYTAWEGTPGFEAETADFVSPFPDARIVVPEDMRGWDGFIRGVGMFDCDPGSHD